MSWMIFNDTVMGDPLKYPYNCGETVDGECTRGLTFKQCLQRCKEGNGCHSGMYLKVPGAPSWCVDSNTIVNPSISLRNKNYYNVSINAEATSFIDTKVFPYPPDDANTVMYLETLTLESVKDNYKLMNTSSTAYFGQGMGATLELLQRNPSRFKDKVRFKDYIGITIRQSNLLLKKDKDKTSVSFQPQVSWQLESDDLVQLVDPSGDNIDRVVNYGDKFAIKYMDKYYLTVNDKNLPEFSPSEPHLFSFNQSGTGSYCDNNQCVQISFTKGVKNGSKLRYTKDGIHHPIYKSKRCYEICDKTNTKNMLLIFITITIAVIIYILFQYNK